MLKRIALVGLTCVAVGAHAEDPSKAIDATGYNGAARLPEVALAPNDLTLDPAFSTFSGGLGMSVFWPGGEGTSIEYGLRVFPSVTCSGGTIPFCTLTGYFVAGRRQLVSGDWSGIVTRRKLDGGFDSTFGGNSGWISRGNFAKVNDFAMLNDRIYVAGTRWVAGKEVFAVSCVELSTATDCSGFVSPNESFATHGATGNAVAKRIVADAAYGLLVAGYVGTAQGNVIAVARFDAATGALIGQFNGDGLMESVPSWASISSNVDVYAMALAPPGTAGGARVYIAGTARRTATDYDGFVLALHPGTGSGISGWSPTPAIYEEHDNTGNKRDAVTTIVVQRNGQLAMAGWSETDTANEHRLILSRFNADGTGDNAFCDGAVTCVRNDPTVGVVDDDWPVAIAERDGNRDLVVALTHNGSNASDPHPRQSVWQFGSSGNVKHASQVMDYSGPPGGAVQQRWSSPAGMWIGNAGLGGTGSEVIAIVGTRKWDDTDYDMTLSHLIANDSIYADQFGGPNSD